MAVGARWRWLVGSAMEVTAVQVEMTTLDLDQVRATSHARLGDRDRSWALDDVDDRMDFYLRPAASIGLGDADVRGSKNDPGRAALSGDALSDPNPDQRVRGHHLAGRIRRLRRRRRGRADHRRRGERPGGGGRPAADAGFSPRRSTGESEHPGGPQKDEHERDDHQAPDDHGDGDDRTPLRRPGGLGAAATGAACNSRVFCSSNSAWVRTPRSRRSASRSSSSDAVAIFPPDRTPYRTASASGQPGFLAECSRLRCGRPSTRSPGRAASRPWRENTAHIGLGCLNPIPHPRLGVVPATSAGVKKRSRWRRPRR